MGDKVKIDENKKYIFKRQVGDGQFECQTEDVVLDGKTVKDIIMSYLHTIVFGDTGFIKYAEGGAIINEDYYKKMVHQSTKNSKQ